MKKNWNAEQKEELKHFRKKRKEFFRVLDWIFKPPLNETFFLDDLGIRIFPVSPVFPHLTLMIRQNLQIRFINVK